MDKRKDINNGHTLTSIFMLPLFGISWFTYKNAGFINAYIGDPERIYTNDAVLIYLLFKPVDEQVSYMCVLLDEMMEQGMVADSYSRDSYEIVVLLLDDKFKWDYQRFLKGEYSKFSQLYRDTCPKQGKMEGKEIAGHQTFETFRSSQLRIVEKDPTWKEFVEEFYDIELPADGEVHESPKLEREIINWDKL